MPQIAAEELSVPMAHVTVIQGDTLLTPDQGVTFGSLSIQNGGMQIRQAAATAREALLAEGATKLGAAKDALTVKDGVVVPKSGGAGVTYAQLIGGKDFTIKVDAKAVPKDPKDYTIVGKPVARLDIPDKVTGKFTYMQDFKRPGMIHARVVRPPALKANLQRYNDSECLKIPGYIGVVKKGNFLAVLGKTEWAAIRASRAIETNWSDWQGLPEKSKLWEYVRNTKVNKDEDLQKVGNSAEALGAPGVKQIKATYDFAIHTHGSIGPSCAVAEYVDGKLTSWSASQQTHLLRKQMASMLNMKPDDVRCIYIEGAGCYGRNGHEDAAADAALIAKETGVPVRVQWMRADEHGWDPKEDPHPGNIHQALAIPYTIPNIKATAHWLAETPFKPSWIRAPGRMQNTFGNESFIDELAAAAGVDPLELRLRNLMSDRRGLELLDRLVELSAWKPRPRGAARSGGDVAAGRGVSYVHYELVRTHVGDCAHVEVDRKT